ncbi:MAG TPA: hypothetical protein VN032_00150 [Thermoanaerobaculia bacterium]|jgi:hypothetical protein|nr:hypothetical protein [Thermoanaerobaculia bacterium]
MNARPRAVLRTVAIGAWLAVAAVLFAGRNVDPFQGPYRLKVSEPMEGASIPEGSVRVTAELEKQPGQAAAAKDATPPPKPRLEIFLDNEPKGAIKDGQTTLTIEGVAAGTHTLLVTSSDPGSGAVLERKEIHFTALPPAPQ